MSQTFLPQLHRASRYLNRIRAMYKGIFSSTGHDPLSYEDDLISFFIHCYHIKDWVVQSGEIEKRVAEEFINTQKALKICADICNGSKHFKVIRSLRSGAQPKLAYKKLSYSTWLTGSGGGEVLQVGFVVSSNGLEIDALELAENCMDTWCAFLRDRGLIDEAKSG